MNNRMVLSYIIPIMIIVIGCSQKSIECHYKMKSLATGNELTKEYELRIEKGKRFYYLSQNDSIQYFVEVDCDTIKVDSDGDENLFSILGEKCYDIQDTSLRVKCFYPCEEGKLGEGVWIFYTERYGIFLERYSSGVTELIHFNGKSHDVKNIIEKVKNDSIFFKYGGVKPIEPPLFD
ncbi:hypothetical protein EYV94_18470 [Puteibacter caeruleilacunae]|nr:hypothetical protein EYV94_18470 [Puteibacter caeruleilacunae]